MSTQKLVPKCSQQLYLSQVKPETTKYQSTGKQLNTIEHIMVYPHNKQQKATHD